MENIQINHELRIQKSTRSKGTEQRLNMEELILKIYGCASRRELLPPSKHPSLWQEKCLETPPPSRTLDAQFSHEKQQRIYIITRCTVPTSQETAKTSISARFALILIVLLLSISIS